MVTNLRTYELAVELYKACELITVKQPVRSQLSRASLSVVLNIAEGAAKKSVADRRRFYQIAFGSLKETQCLLKLIDRENEFKMSDVTGAYLYKLMTNTR